ncbi:hypothetical protein DCAR_0101193 [Daucus carota subsp. sativus]|uniref:Uncharacterized protein n=1 Tax=Daucus carota subsp. sativus TaxID=79200 RepID=A0A166G790_DAUCS|nr:hypothetical protein DCAR_0101193 [Daucus carota subsp. sativus]
MCVITNQVKTSCFSHSTFPSLRWTFPSENAVGNSIVHSIFVKGEQMNYEMKEDDLDAVELYPDYKYTSVDELLDIFMVDPPKPGVAALE